MKKRDGDDSSLSGRQKLSAKHHWVALGGLLLSFCMLLPADGSAAEELAVESAAHTRQRNCRQRSGHPVTLDRSVSWWGMETKKLCAHGIGQTING